MKRKILVIAIINCLIIIGLTGCKKRSESIVITGKHLFSNNVVNIKIDKNYTFKDYTISETEDGIEAILRFKPYHDEDK